MNRVRLNIYVTLELIDKSTGTLIDTVALFDSSICSTWWSKGRVERRVEALTTWVAFNKFTRQYYKVPTFQLLEKTKWSKSLLTTPHFNAPRLALELQSETVLLSECLVVVKDLYYRTRGLTPKERY